MITLTNPDTGFAGINLENYLIPKSNERKQEISVFNKSISKLENYGLTSERLQLDELRQRRLILQKDERASEIPYPVLDTSFLRMHNRKNLYKVPKFSIYPLYGENEFSVDLKIFNTNIREPLFRKELEIGINNTNISYNFTRAASGLSCLAGLGALIPATAGGFATVILTINEIAESLGIGGTLKDSASVLFTGIITAGSLAFSGVSGLLYNYLSPPERITSTFNGIIPNETKERVRNAERYFNRDDFYIIAETKPEEWQITKKITKDPLMTAVKHNKCFLVDHFDTTPLEKFIVNQYSLLNQ